MARLFFPTESVQKSALIAWGCGLLPINMRIDPAMAEPIAVVSDDGARVMAVAIFHEYRPEMGLIELTAAAKAHPIWWAHRDLMAGILRYPFVQLKARKLVVHVPQGNRAAMRFAEKAGLVHEASLRHHYANKIHAAVWSMTAKEYGKSAWAERKAEAA